MQTEPLTQAEVAILEDKFESNWNFLVKFGIVGGLIGFISMFIPLDILSKARRSGVAGSLVENNGFLGASIMVLCTLGVLWLILYFVMVYELKKDLKLKEKVIGKVKVQRIEHLSDDLAKAMENHEDAILHFESNDYKIKKLYFNKGRNPNYLNTRYMLVERSKYSKTVFKSEVVD